MVFDLFSKRRRIERGEIADIYTYDQLSRSLRVQITYLFDSVFNELRYFQNVREDLYQNLAQILREERGVYQLQNGTVKDFYSEVWRYEKEVKNYFLLEENTELSLDVVELFFSLTLSCLERNYSSLDWNHTFKNIISRLNIRFREHGVGYSYENGHILRIDSELIHKNFIKPTLILLHDKEFKNAEEEYYSAHEHYRHGRYSECLVDCLKAIETTIKIIAHNKNWKNVQEKDTASKLIEHVMLNKLIPDYLQSHFNALRSCLESGVPTVRNKEGGHGKGVRKTSTPSYIAEYLLGEAACVIRLLVEAYTAA